MIDMNPLARDEGQPSSDLPATSLINSGEHSCITNCQLFQGPLRSELPFSLTLHEVSFNLEAFARPHRGSHELLVFEDQWAFVSVIV